MPKLLFSLLIVMVLLSESSTIVILLGVMLIIEVVYILELAEIFKTGSPGVSPYSTM
jgi:hypothetical protein